MGRVVCARGAEGAEVQEVMLKAFVVRFGQCGVALYGQNNAVERRAPGIRALMSPSVVEKLVAWCEHVISILPDVEGNVRVARRGYGLLSTTYISAHQSFSTRSCREILFSWRTQ